MAPVRDCTRTSFKASPPVCERGLIEIIAPLRDYGHGPYVDGHCVLIEIMAPVRERTGASLKFHATVRELTGASFYSWPLFTYGPCAGSYWGRFAIMAPVRERTGGPLY